MFKKNVNVKQLKRSFVLLMLLFKSAWILAQSTPVIGVPTYRNGVRSGDPGANAFSGVFYDPGQGTATLGSSTGFNLANYNDIGACWGTAYDPRVNKFYSASVLKRHADYGSWGSGAIYVINADFNSPSTSLYINLDGATGTLPGGGTVTINTGDASDHGNLGSGSFPGTDNPAFGLSGKSSLGDMDISPTNNTLWVINAKDRQLIEVDISNPGAPVVGKVYPINISSTGITPVDGEIRPWGIEVAQDGNVYIGVVASAENVSPATPLSAGPINLSDNAIRESPANRAKLQGYVLRLNKITGAFTQVNNFALDYLRGGPGVGIANTAEWVPWFDDYTLAFPNTGDGYFQIYPQPLISNIEITADGNMFVAVMDRFGLQTSSEGNSKPGPSTTFDERGRPSGDLLKFAPSGAVWSNTPSLYLGDALSLPENEAALGSMAVKYGQNELVATTIDAINASSNGLTVLSTNGALIDNQDLQTYATNPIMASKGMALGDVEIGYAGPPPPCSQPDFSMLQNLSTCSGAVPNNDGSIVLSSVFNGDKYGVSNGAVYSGPNYAAANAILSLPLNLVSSIQNSPSQTFTIRLFNGADTCYKDTTIISTAVPCGPPPLGSIGNYVWLDVNSNGTNDEPSSAGINGVTVYLLDASSNIIDSTLTANDGGGNPGYYNFPNLSSGTYYVQFPTSNGGNGLTTQDPTAQTDNNSDANTISGISPAIVINASGSGQDKDNTTIDAGYISMQGLGNYVWLDNDGDGLQDSNEPGVAGVTVDLYSNGIDGLPNTSDDVLVGSTSTDAYGFYYFNNLATGNYNLGFTPPANYTFTQQVNAGDNQDNTNSNPDPTVGANYGRTGTINLSTNEQDSTIDAGLILPQISTASVGDYVWFDSDADGVQDANESGVSGVTVSLLNASGNIVATTLTDASGHYLFTDVVPGTYSVKFTAPIGTTLTTTGSDGVAGTVGDSGTDSDAGSSGQTPTFVVAAGDNIRNVDAGLVAQSNTVASLGDRVWYDIDQDGVQDAGEPGIQGVTVNLKDSTGTIIGTTTTDAFGNYSFNNLTPGSYSVQFVAPVGYTASPADTAIGGNGSGANASDSDADPTSGNTGVVTLLAGNRNSSIDAGFYLPAILNNLGNYVWNDLDKDGIQDANEPGVAGVTATLFDGSGNVVNNPATGTPYVVSTDANGMYMFVGLVDGNYQVQFSNLPAGFSYTQNNTPGDNGNNTNSDANTLGRTPVFNLSGGETDLSVDAGIVAGDAGQTASLGNKVWYDLNNDGIQDADETGVSGVTVTLKEAGPDGIAGNGDDVTIATTSTNGEGEYIFTNLAAGTYYVEFSNLPSGYNASPSNSGSNDALDSDGGAISGGISSTVATPVSLSAGEENLTVDLGIYKPLVNSIGNYVWIDANQDGQQGPASTEPPVPGVQVTLLDASGNVFDIDPVSPGVQPYVTTTDAEGKYLFTDLPDGTYSVQFSNLPSGFQFTLANSGADVSDSDPDANTGKTGTVTVTGGQTDLTLDAGIYSTSKAVLGNYVWSDDNADGIQDSGEAGIAGVLVTLYDNSNNAIATTMTDANGYYLFPNLDPGTYSVGFSNLPDGTNFTQQNVGSDATDSDVDPNTGRTASVTLVAGDVNLSLDAGVTPPNTATVGDYVWFDINADGIQDANEPPLPGAIVTLKDGSGNVIGQTVTDGTGHYLFTNVPAGNGYTIEFSANLPDYGAMSGNAGETPMYTTQDPSNLGNNGSIVPSGPASGNAVAVTAPFNVAPNTHTRLLDAGIIAATPLPISGIVVNVLQNSSSNEVVWSGLNPENVARYELYKGQTSSAMTKVNEQTAVSANLYKFIDNEILNGITYYQVVSVDQEGHQFRSAIVTVIRKGALQIELYPNPISNQLNIKFNDILNSNKDIRIVDALGKVVMVTQALKGRSLLSVDVSSLAAGAYLIQLGDQSFRVNKQ